jgi:hypothetical protein
VCVFRSTLDGTEPLLFNDGEAVATKEQRAMRAIELAKRAEIELLKGEVEEWDMSIEIKKKAEQDKEIARLRAEVAKREAVRIIQENLILWELVLAYMVGDRVL